MDARIKSGHDDSGGGSGGSILCATTERRMNLTEAPAELTSFAAMAWAWSVAFLPRLGGAFIILIVGVMLARLVSRLVRVTLERTGHFDLTVEPVLATAARYAVLIVVLLAALAQIGVQTTSLIAALGAAGLAIGLALQGTLQNIAAGIMLLYLRPFRTGDTIETPIIMGKVKEIGLFVTNLETLDGLFYFVPNSMLWNVPLKNHTRNPRRQVTITISVSYEANLAEVRRVLSEVAASEPRVLRDPQPVVGVESYLDTRVVVALRAWVPTADYADAQRALAEAVKGRLQAAGIKVPL
jgi:small conductance mechanosensitive channel